MRCQPSGCLRAIAGRTACARAVASNTSRMVSAMAHATGGPGGCQGAPGAGAILPRRGGLPCAHDRPSCSFPCPCLVALSLGAPAHATAAAGPRAAGGGQPKADLVLRGGRVHTLDAARPLATAVAVSGNQVLAVGSDAEIAPLVGSATRVIELAGRTVVPGFNDSHAHLLGIGFRPARRRPRRDAQLRGGGRARRRPPSRRGGRASGSAAAAGTRASGRRRRPGPCAAFPCTPR